MGWLKNLQNKFREWLVLKGITWAFERLSSEHLGQKLNYAMDKKFGKSVSDQSQKHLAHWLREVAKEVEA